MLEQATLTQLEEWMAAHDMGGHWQLDPEALYTGAPLTAVQPHVWRWAEVWEAVQGAGALVPLDVAERRSVRLLNPGLARQGRRFTAQTMQLSVTIVKPGEAARAHRHTPAAYRFIVQGSGGYTTVEGQQCRMEAGDLILTPAWTWHNHANDGDEPIVWLDGLDHPLVTLLQLNMFEPYPADAQPIERGSDEVAALYGTARPAVAPGTVQPDYYHYRWRDTYPALRALAARGEFASAYDGIRLEYRNPQTGGPTLPTMSHALQWLRPGESTRAHRHLSTTIYHVVRGRGHTRIGDEEFEWSQGDSFVVPIWQPHAHTIRAPGEDAILFSVDDAPVARAFGLYREEAC
jgi:gentisate 1,2-dioxygenase